jgi:class 3 adenylate cyclase
MWDKDTSSGRVSKQWANLKAEDITVERLTREMDLSNLSATDVRIVHGAHFYLDVTNIRQLVESGVLRREDFKPLHRYMHVLRMELRRITQQVFDGDKIQVQGPKFHGLLYKPYDDDETLAWHAVLIGIALTETVRASLPQVFSDYPSMTPSVGISLGDTIVANIGARGNRELISIGSAANHAAKILGTPNALVVTPDLWSALSEERRQLFAEDGDNYKLDWLLAGGDTVAEEGFQWSQEDSAKRMQESVDALPLSVIESHDAQSRIDIDGLGPKHFKTCMAGTIFVDIDGYTALIDSKMDDEDELKKAVKLLQLFRHELHSVTTDDFDGVTIQHQGDRLQAIVHLPTDNDDRIKEKLAELCISCNSSVEQVLNKDFVVFEEYHVAIGASFGKTVVVRSGTKGDLDASCFGDAVLNAEELQMMAKGGEIRISKGVFASISDETIQKFFTFDSPTDSYKAAGLTWSEIDDAGSRKKFAAKAAVGFNTVTRQIDKKDDGDGRPRPNVVPVKNTRNWCR